MQRDLLPNTYRDINELPPSPSQPDIESMDVETDFQRPIIHPVENQQIDLPKRNQITNRPLLRSMIRTNDNDTERFLIQPPLENTANNENALAQATGFDTNLTGAIDSDEALARELQQKEYSRDSLIPTRHPYERFRIPSDDEIRVIDPEHSLEPDVMPHFETDEEFAAYLQAQEDRKRERFHRRPISFFPAPPRPNPTSSENGQTSNDHGFPAGFRYPVRTNDNDDDDDDHEDEYRSADFNSVLPFLHLLQNPSFNPEVFSPFMFGHRRNYRRTGNLQDTEDDFGPEDYERLLQLDDTIRKKKLTQHQIDSIKQIPFHSNVNNTDEENKCGVCLELFEENQSLRQFPCLHVYHKPCADRWLRENNVCPVCRKPPVEIQSSNSSRRHYNKTSNNNNNHHNNSRRPPPTTNNRSSTNRQQSTSSSTMSNNNHQSHRGPGRPPFQRPS